MPYNQNNPNRELFKFYEKVRVHLDDLELQDDGSSQLQSFDKRTNEKPSEEELYGYIDKDEFIKILNSYDKQQESQDLQEKPVTCDKVVGGNYAKLLYSKPGFHHLGSTSHLVKNLEIRNIHRNSFLAGHSTFCTTKEEDLTSLKDYHEKMSIRQITDLAINHINNNEFDLANKEITKAYNLDPKNGDVLATRGRYYMAKKEYSDAAGFFRSALNHKPRDENNVRMYLSDTLYQHGLLHYNKREYKEARNLLSDSIKYNPDNQGAKLHKTLCEDELQRQTPFAQKPPAYRK